MFTWVASMVPTMTDTRPRIRKAVIPAAGLGTRFLPATKATPKEMLPVVDKPAIQYVVEEAVSAGLDDVLMITGRNKRPLEDHFDRNYELESALQKKGDAGRLADDEHPEHGVMFDGRTAENFKLASGTWVHVGELRIALVAACSPLVADAVITGHDRDEIGALVFAAPGRALDPDALADGLRRCNATRSASSTRIARVLVLAEPPSIDAGEITDKGYLNQRAILARRAADVARLYAGGDGVLLL